MYHTIKTLSKLGKSQREIASELGLSKTTVNKYCRMDEAIAEVRCCRRTGNSTFSIAEDYVRNRLANYPKLRASRLYEEVITKYPNIKSKQRAFRSFVKQIRDGLPKSSKRLFSIVDSSPGHQVQVDMGETWIDLASGNRIKVYFCSFVLSFSRQLYVHCQSTPYKTKDFIVAHQHAFQYFGGYPKECVYDQTKLVVIKEIYREVLFNHEFHQYANSIGFHPHVCEGYDPQSKGKVERCIQEVKQGFLYGTKFHDIVDVRNKMHDWLNKFNRRVHATTNQAPHKLWEEEKLLLKQLNTDFLARNIRRADKTGLISFCGNKYSVPLNYQNKMVYVDELDGMLMISDIDTGKFVTDHNISFEKGRIFKNQNHYRDYSITLNELKEKALRQLSEHDNGTVLVEKVITDNPRIARDQLRALIRLSGKYDYTTWNKAMPSMVNMPIIKATLIEDILIRVQYHKKMDFALPMGNAQTVSRSLIQRPLSAYMEVLNND